MLEISKNMSSTHRGERIHRIPVAVPVIHNDGGRRDARDAEFPRDVCSQCVEAWSPVRPGDVQMLFRACNLE